MKTVHPEQVNQDLTLMESSSTDTNYNYILQQAQPLAASLSEANLLRSLVHIAQKLCHGLVHVMLLDTQGDLRLRATSSNAMETILLNEPASDDNARVNPVPYVEANRLYTPLLYNNDDILGMVSVEIEDDESADSVVLAMQTVCAFGAVGLVNARTVGENSPIDISHIIERTRLAAMNELAAAAAHQLNNPLTTILADTEMLLITVDKSSREYIGLNAISRAGQRAAEVVRRLMAVGQPDQMDGIPRAVDVVGTIENVLGQLNQYIQMDNIVLETFYPEERPTVHTRPDSLGDVWLNIVMNARDAVVNRERGLIHIEVTYHPEDDVVRVQVSDNGTGITEHAMHTIFEPFYTTRSSAERMGLGLHTSKRIVENAGGTIDVMPEDPEGTRVIVSLPVTKGDG